MKTKQYITLLLAVITLALTSCSAFAVKIKPSSHYVTKDVKVPDFTAISTSTSIDIEYTQGGKKVKIYAPDNLIDYVSVTVNNNELTVKYNQNNMQINGKCNVKVIVSAPSVSKFTTYSAGDIDIKSDIKLNTPVTFLTKSAGDIEGLNVSAPEVSMATSSAGDIEFNNIKTQDLSLTTKSAGDIKIVNAESNDTEIRINSAGDITVETLTCKTLEATTNSSGDVKVAGRCSRATYTSNSAGDIKASRMIAVDVNATTTSAGNIKCYASGNLRVRRSSVGDIGYAGNPKNIEYGPQKGIYKLDD